MSDRHVGNRRRASGRILAVLSTSLATACTGATVGSGVGETSFGDAPYYAGRDLPAGSVAYLPIAFQAGASGPASFDLASENGTPVADLLRAMNAYLDGVAQARQLHAAEPLPGTPPDVRFGCVEDEWGECAAPDDGRDPEMRLAVGRPSGEWTGAAATRLADEGADLLLVLTLETGRYWPRQTNWRGSKAVDLGTDRTLPLPWLTSLDDPVSVLQITGSLMGPDGRAVRIGAEGLLARRTSIVLSGFDVQALVTEDDVRMLMTQRVGDDPGAPLVWQKAIDDLLDGLTHSATRARSTTR